MPGLLTDWNGGAYVAHPQADVSAVPAPVRKMRIYVAGPYTQGDVAQNVRAAIFDADFIESHLGHSVYIPHLTHFWHMLMPHEHEFWMKHDLEWLELCDAVLRLPGESAGADREVEFARERGMKIYHSVFDIPSAK
jgi:Domain of unknown function (DUF4406)